MLAGRARTGAGVIVVGALAGCLPSPEHRCASSDECGGTGTCVDDHCAFPAADCGSGLRFGDGAGALAGTCTGAVIDAGLDGPPTLPRFGRGLDGAVMVGPPPTDYTINTCAPLLPTAAGVTAVTFDPLRMSRASYTGLGDFAADRVVLIWQTTGLANPPAIGEQTALALGDVGRYQLVLVTEAGPGTLKLAEPLAFAVVDGAQVCRVPELTKVTVAAGTVGGALQGGSLRAPVWNGAAGGVIALYASEGVSITGASSAVAGSSRGLRGGPGTNTTNTRTNCTALVGPTSAGGGARRGEGLSPARFATTGSAAETFGRGNATLGGGGGDCLNAGGGGGGGAGAGGRGGFQAAPAQTGNGLGGVAATFDPRDHLAFGGGGGGGEGDEAAAGNGSPGGGVVLLRTATLACAGTNGVRSNGGDGGNSLTAGGTAGDDGGGGGGGGGTIYVEAGTIDTCLFSAHGGNGGATRPDPMTADVLRGPGGGGGGGRVLVRADSAVAATYAVGGGNAGTVTGAGSSHGAENGRSGVRCGDGVAAAGEACDDGNLVRGDGCDQCVRE